MLCLNPNNIRIVFETLCGIMSDIFLTYLHKTSNIKPNHFDQNELEKLNKEGGNMFYIIIKQLMQENPHGGHFEISRGSRNITTSNKILGTSSKDFKWGLNLFLPKTLIISDLNLKSILIKYANQWVIKFVKRKHIFQFKP